MARRAIVAREEDGEKGEDQADDFEERIERREHEHAVKGIRVRRQLQHCDRGDRETERSDERGRGDGSFTFR